MFEIDKMKFGSFVASLRKGLGMTQKELAQKLFVSDKAVSKWETGSSMPDITLLIPLSEVLGVSVTELLECERKEVGNDTEQVVRKAIQMTQKKNHSVYWFMPAVILCALEMVGLKYYVHPHYYQQVLLMMVLVAFFGGHACFFLKDRLPVYYDSHKINYYTNGFFRIHLLGLSFNNNNWPYIVRVIRVWSISMLFFYPIGYVLVMSLFEPWINQANMILIFIVLVLGLLFPVYFVGKKYA